MGRQTIQGRAREVAAQVELFLAFNPDMDIQGLQNSEKFKAIVLQQVGITGYTCLYEAGTGIMRLHPNPDLIGQKMEILSERIPAWWGIFAPSLAGVEVSGYYDWIEPDGRVRSKYMAITPVAVKLQGKTLMVAATTYIDEFSIPILAMRSKSEEVRKDYEDFITRQATIFGGVMAAILISTLLAVYGFAQRATRRFIRPIVALADAAEEFGEGRREVEEAASILGRSDEIGALARAFQRMRAQIRGQIEHLKNNLAQLKSTQQALKKSEEHYHSLFDNVPIGLYRTTPDGRIIDANLMLVRMFRCPDKEALLSLRAEEMYVNAEDRRLFMKAADDQPAGSQYEFQMRRCDGAAIWVENQSTVFRDREGRVLYYEGSLKDITERKLSEKALRESEARFRTAFENASVGMALVSLRGTFLEVNLALAQMIGYGPADMVGRPVAEFTHPSDLDPRAQFIDDLIEGRVTYGEQERRFIHRDGTVVWALIWASVQRDQYNQPLYFISLVQDISARKHADEEKEKLESRLVQAQKMEAIGALAGGIAHDFNNILAAIIGYMELSLQNGDETAEFLRQGLNAASRARDLVKQILVFSRQAHEERMPVNVEVVVKEVMKFLRASVPATISITCRMPGKPGAVLANSVELHQILMNLCTNAVHAIGAQHGTIEIEAQRVEISSAERSAFPDVDPGRYLKLSVKDTGQGIPHEIQDRIFDPYFTTKEKGVGTGLGLAVVHGIVKKSNGAIRVESELGKGSCFHIYLPQVDMISADPSERHELPQGGSERILFVDDEKMLVDVGERILKLLGYEVSSRISPIDALDLFKAKPGYFDLVITDQTMPGMTGEALAKKLLQIRPGIPVIICTGYSHIIDPAKAREKGITALVMKPILIHELAAAIRDALGRA
ncbi:MAG: PAS domain S-box protein [Hyphomicrobiales bacterium]